MFLSTDFGQTWTPKATPSNQLFNSLTIDPQLLNRLYAVGTNDVLFIISDGAASWVVSPENALYPGKDLALLPRQCSGGGLFGISAQVVRSPDFGSTWQTLSQFDSIGSLAAGPGCALYATRSLTSDAFVAKLAPGGTEVLWSTFLGAGGESATALAVDPAGNVYVAGQTYSSDFPATAPRIGPGGGAPDIFVAKYDPSGHVAYSVVLGADSYHKVTGLAVDKQGNAHVVGSTDSQNFPVTPGAFQTLSSMYGNGFVVKLAPDGSLIYASYVGTPTSVAVDQSGQALLTFESGPDGLPVTPDALQSAPGPGFLIRVDPAGSTITYATYLDGFPLAVATDSLGSVYVAGSAATPGFTTTPGAYNSGLRSQNCVDAQQNRDIVPPIWPGGDVFVLKLAASNLQPVYAALLGSECGGTPAGLAVDSQGSVVLPVAAGFGFPLRSPLAGAPSDGAVYPLGLPGGVLVAKLDPTGSTLAWSSYLQGSTGVVAPAPDGSLYLGVTSGVAVGHGSVLRFPMPMAQTVSIDSVANAFSGFSYAIAPGSLVTLTGTNLSPTSIDLRLNSDRALPTELGGVSVYFDGAPFRFCKLVPVGSSAWRRSAFRTRLYYR